VTCDENGAVMMSWALPLYKVTAMLSNVTAFLAQCPTKLGVLCKYLM